MKIKTSQGISLIVLVITIIVIVILAGAVILFLASNNSINSANRAVFMSDVKSFQSELELYKANQYLINLGTYDPIKLYADENNIIYNGINQIGNIQTIITLLENNNKYNGEFEILSGELVYKGLSTIKQEWATDAGILIDNGHPLVSVSTVQTLPVKPGIPVEYTISFLSNQVISTINLENNILITDIQGAAILIQPSITNVLSPESTDLAKIITLTIDTTQLEEGNYKVKILAGTVTNESGLSNMTDVLSGISFTIDNTAPLMPTFTTVPEDLTNWVVGNVQVTINYPADADKKEYSIDGTNWQTYTTEITVLTNCIIYAKATDISENTSNVSTLEITKIDEELPQITTINVVSTGASVSGTISLLDNESEIDISQSKYLVTTESLGYEVNNQIWNTETAKTLTSNPQNIVEVVTDGDYYLQVLASDKAGNKRVDVSGKITVASKIGNIPVLAPGMTAIKWNGSNWVTTTVDDTNWYDYKTKQWANAQTLDGSMWVWIPRYEYRIPVTHSSTAQVIAVNFLNSTETTATSGYIVHPAFTFGNIELTGIWMAKFEAGGTASGVVVKPGVKALVNITVSGMFTASRNMETNSIYGWGTTGNGIDTHMIKNIEWGAVAYLSSSAYGKSGEIQQNTYNGYYTGGGLGTAYVTNVNQSTTGNVYGVYDMSGGVFEYIAAYINNGTANLTTYASSLLYADNKYKDLYVFNVDVIGTYSASSSKFGDAVYETSTSYTGASAWYIDYTQMPIGTSPFFIRGGNEATGSGRAGLFNFDRNTGNLRYDFGFRPVIVVDESL